VKVEQAYTKLDDSHYQRRRIEDVSRAINGQIEFGDPKSGPINVSGFWVDITTPSTPNTSFTVNHNLGRIPTGMIVFAVDKAGAVINVVNKSIWTTKQAFFECNDPSVSLQGFVT